MFTGLQRGCGGGRDMVWLLVWLFVHAVDVLGISALLVIRVVEN